MNRKKVMTVFGTRPEAIKMAPVLERFNQNEKFSLKTVVTAQHREMLDQVLDLFKIKPAYDLNIMVKSQTLHRVASECISGLEKVLRKERPDLVLVHGDTATTLASALASYYCRIPVGHVEAGLRTYDPYNPFPEEQNRRLTDALCTFHLAPTSRNKENLIKENIDPEGIFVTGNTVIDSLLSTANKDIEPENEDLKKIEPSQKIVLLTAHRRENFGEPLKNIYTGVNRLSEKFDNLIFIYPVHKNPNVVKTVNKYLKKNSRVVLVPPLSYSDTVWLLKKCYFVMTDSGGLQEEAPSFKKPVLVIRKVTERPEAVQAGTVKVINTDSDSVFKWGEKLMQDRSLYTRFSTAVNPYGDGKAAQRIVQFIEYKFKMRKKRPKQWKI
ncbi:MAG: non-hydrolyzing UDP-N-acetylglucosamine 2-epimerase [Elusimicrobiota bacterium]